MKRYHAAVGETATYLMAHRSEFRASRQAGEDAAEARERNGAPTFATTLNTASMQHTAGLVQRFGLVKDEMRVGTLTGGEGA